MAEETPNNLFQRIAACVMHAHTWVADHLHSSDWAIARMLREDLGLNPDATGAPPEAPPGTRDKIDAFIRKSSNEIPEQALAEAIGEIVKLVDTIRTFVDAVKADGTDTWDTYNLMFQVWVHDSLRLSDPSMYALMRVAGLFTQEPEMLGQLDPEPLLRMLRGEADSTDAEAWVSRLSLVAGVGIVIAERASRAVDGVLDATYGWDIEPAEAPRASAVAARTLTLVFTLPTLGGLKPAVTLVGVPKADGGPGIFLTVSAGFEVAHESGTMKYTLAITSGGGFGLFVPFSAGAASVRAFGGSSPTIAFRVDPTDAAATKPAYVWPKKEGTRLEIGAFAFGVDAGPDRAGFRAAVRKGKLVIHFGEGDSFLKWLPRGSVEVPFDLGIVADTSGGFRFEGGTGLRVFKPIAASIAGVFTIQYIELELRLTAGVALDLRGGFSLKLGPFKVSVDRVGLTFDLSTLRRGFDLGKLVKFAPPRGIGLVLEAGPVKGGGYLLIDAERGEYAGALELTILSVGIKAIGVLNTRRPDGSAGWSLLLLVFGQFKVLIGPGIFWTGLGGMIGLHHRTDFAALTEGMKTGALDDVLFPKDPIADAPRLIARYQQLFPVEEGSLLLGPMLELSFSDPPIVYVRLGFVFEVKNALGEGPLKLGKVVLLGQLLAQLPPKDTGAPATLKLLVDVVGFYEAEEKFLFIRARLRDSFVGVEGFAKLNLAGELLLVGRFGEPRSFVLAAGGFHPAFRDLPAGVPADLQRLTVSFKIGPLALRSELYFAVTSNSVQGGFKSEVKADFGVASIKGWLGFDALLFLSPRFHFLVGLSFNVAVRAYGTNIASVGVEMSLEGPGEWHAVGKFTFSILWWDVDVGFDERWGVTPALAAAEPVSAAAALLAEMNDPRRLEPLGPIGGNGLVTMAKIEGDLVLAHPLGQFAVRQKAVPLGVRIDRMGTRRLTEGAPLFEVSEVRVGGVPTSKWEPVTDHFARGQYMELSEQEKLAGRSFERLPCGVTIGAERFTVPTAMRDIKVVHERKLLEPESTIFAHWKVAPLPAAGLSFTVAARAAGNGAAARSARSLRETLVANAAGAAVVQPAPLAVVAADTLRTTLTLHGPACASPAIAEQHAAAGSVVVEAYEVAS